MISFDIRSRGLSGVLISFRGYFHAEEWYNNHCRVGPSDSRYGCVLVKSKFETEAEANERRMVWLERHQGMNGGRIDLDIPEEFRTLACYIDSLEKPETWTEVILDHFQGCGLPEPGPSAPTECHD
jgi:hypothetical protein